MQQMVLDGRYELDRKVGEGGMARVYLGRDLRLNRRVAIKIPHHHQLNDNDFLERFRHEAQAAAMLSHPNIVDVFDVGRDGDIHYIVMEYVEGVDLKTVIIREGPLPVARAVAIAEQIARGLAAAHQAGMVHRDIKPQNVIVTTDGQAHITDFGVAKSHLSTALTETGVSFGTVDYLSPEQAQGRPALPQSDIYSLGVVLYEMLTGRLPFSGENAIAVAMKHVSEHPRPPRQLNSQIPPGLEALILRALAKDPAQRPASAAAFAGMLRDYDRLANQETQINPGAVRTQAPEAPSLRQLPAQRPANGGNSGRVMIPPPRSTPARAKQQDGLGCGVFVVGMLILAGVLGIVLVFASGTFNGVFDGFFAGGGPRPTSIPDATSTTTTTPEPSPTPELLVSVPDLSALNGAAAQSALRELQLIPVQLSESNSSVPIGQVISQEVPAGSELRPGQSVTYSVSLGPLFLVVPDVIGIRGEVARQQIEGIGLIAQVREVPSRSVDAGFVISQSPSGGLRVEAGNVVDIVVSLGDVVRLPDLIGLQRDQAEQILAGSEGLTLSFVDEQGCDRLPNCEQYRPNEVVSASRVLASGEIIGLNNGDNVPRGSRIVLGVRAP
ncbi:MAG: Stk1 family PASTA domain-containing Ser/Thr kinase [Oscillochloris sp.]|nr:Stk1 family PASTA domain-containing Ser/Thr kinase [Oscillochloris sp.]